MKTIGLMQAMGLCRQFQKLPPHERQEMRDRRLRELVTYARKNSPYFAELYRDIPEQFSLSDLPPTNKRDLMAHWDSWVTDRSVTLQQIQQFMQDKDNIGRKWHKK